MRLFSAVALGVAALALLVLVSDNVEASSDCRTGNWCMGWAQVSTTTGGVSSTRCFSLRTTNTAPACPTTTADETTWQVDAGGCLDLYWFDTTQGVSPPAAPNKVTIQIRRDNSANIHATLLNAGAEPANGQSFQFCSDLGGPIAGTFRIFINPVKDNGAGGVGNYNINSDGTATVGAISHYDRGALRGRMVLASLTRSAYPAGSTFAYGPAGDEQITITSSFTAPNTDANVETMRSGILDSATHLVGQGGPAVDIDGGPGSLVQSFTADQTFPVANNPWVPFLDIAGNSVLTGMRWTIYASTGHGAGISLLSDTAAINTATFNIDPRIVYDSDGVGTFATADDDLVAHLNNGAGPVIAVANLGEMLHAEWYLFNARGEKLTRAMTFVENDGTANCFASGTSITPSGAGLYTIAGTVAAGTCGTAATEAGVARYFRATNTDQDHRASAVSYSISTLLKPEAHLDLETPRSATEDLAFYVRAGAGGTDASDTIHLSCFVGSVRGDAYDTSGNAVSWSIVDPTATTRASGTTDTGSDGWTPADLDLLATTPLGTTWEGRCPVAHNGNSGSDTEAFTVGVEGGGGTEYVGTDPLKVYPAWHEGYLNQSNLLAISAAFMDGTPRVDAELELLVDVTCNGEAVVTGANPVEDQPGSYYYEFPGHDEAGHCRAVVRNTVPATMGAPVANAFTIQNATGNETVAELAALLQAHRDNSLELSMTNDFNGIGFDGFLYLLVLLGIGYLAYRRGLDVHPSWSGVLVLAILGIITIVLGTVWPPAAQVPPAWALLGIAIWVLFVYAASGFGFLTGAWAKRKAAKEEQT